jgi:CubicO group peptidase (beta-lactamase class C family)
MTRGLEWDEKIPYTNPKNGEVQMNKAPDAIDFVLRQKLVDKPGTVFNYSGGCSQLLVALIKKATGMEADLYTEKHLFAPLGIAKYNWVKMKGDDPSAASGLRLRSRDMAKIGLLMMKGGKWNGKRIIPKRLVDMALAEQISITRTPRFEIGYGFQIWLRLFPFQVGGMRVRHQAFNGNGGQFVQIDQDNGLMIAGTAGNYDKGGVRSLEVFSRDYIYPALLDETFDLKVERQPPPNSN